MKAEVRAKETLGNIDHSRAMKDDIICDLLSENRRMRDALQIIAQTNIGISRGNTKRFHNIAKKALED